MVSRDFEKEKMSDRKLWQVFSKYVRLRDADENGYCRCITCARVAHWTKMDCGHGIGRQHKSTKYDERNNHAQCKRCNAFEGGRMDEYARMVDMKYGDGTWDKLRIKSKMPCKRTQFEIYQMTKYYATKLKELERKFIA